MATQDHFFIDLLSDTNNDYFQNSPNHFITPLLQQLILDKESYEVGLTEISYVNSFSIYRNFKLHLTKSSIVDVDSRPLVKTAEKTILLELFALKDIGSIIDELNSAINSFNDAFHLTGATRFRGKFKFSKKSYKVQLSLYATETLRFVPEKFAQLLGFDSADFTSSGLIVYDPNQVTPRHIPENLLVVYNSPSDIPKKYKAKFNADIAAENYHLFIYSNLVEYSTVGDIKAPLLRIIPVDTEYGRLVSLVFNKIYYYPIIAGCFSEILINITNSSGDVVKFDFGKTHIKLHFRRRHVKPRNL